MEHSRFRASATLVVPAQIEIEGGYLLSSQTAPRYVAPKPTILDDFLGIRTDQEVLAYARKWGTLGYCREHGLPDCRTPSRNGGPCWPEEVKNQSASIRSELAWRELVSFWHRTIANANAMRRIGESIQLGKAGAQADWERIIDPVDESARHRSPIERNVRAATGVDYLSQPWKGVRSARIRFGFVMQSWLDLGNIRPFFHWERDRWVIRTVPGAGLWPLFGHLAHYLAMSIIGGTQSVFCSFCGREYFPHRRPSPGQRNCCGDQNCKRDYWRENKRIKAART